MDNDLAEQLRFKKQVADRVAAQTGPKPSPVHCWFCAKNTPWFLCECPKARAAQQARDAGKRDGYPRWNAKTDCIENLDAETIAFNEALGYKVRVPPKKAVTPKPEMLENTGVSQTPKSVTSLENNVLSSVTPSMSQPESVTPQPESVTPRSLAAAERQRRKRERDRSKQKDTEA